ncbi:MAG: ArsA family ATPase [Alphaproteobacteria bacterium]|nr:ArsA family ATPase [Alphaproteobacteria bacterium]
MSLFDRRVLLVTGKGGVGKSTVSAALALEAVRRGKRVLLAEVGGATRMPELFAVQGQGYAVSQLTPGLHTLSITSAAAIEDYIVQQVRVRAIYKLVFRNRIMGPFMDAVPGLHDLVQLGKVFDLERERRRGRPTWDLIVVDAPATGHGLTMLSAPASMMELTVAGPFHENARVVHELFVDPARTGIVLVTLPEEMPVNETVDLYQRLGAYQPQVLACVLNEIHEDPFAPLDAWETARPFLDRPALREAVGYTDRAVRRARQQDEARSRLRDGLPVSLTELPYLYRRDLTPGALSELGQRFAEAG